MLSTILSDIVYELFSSDYGQVETDRQTTHRKQHI